MLSLRFCCAFGLACAGGVAQVAAQGYAQGYGQQPQQQQYPEQPQYQQQYPQQQDMQQQQPPPGYFPTPDAQGSYGYQQQYAPNAMYPQQQQQGYGVQPAAEEPLVSSVEGAFQISAGLGLLQYQSLAISQSGMNPPATDPLAMPGVPPAAAAPAVQQVLYGKIDRHPINLELGYGLSKNILLGALLSMAGSSETLEINGAKAPVSDFMFMLAPKFDYQLSPTSRFNPFVGGIVSLTLHNKKSWPYKDARTLFGVAARGGLRYFVLEQLSIDPSLSVGYMFGSATQKVEGTTPIEFEDSVSGPFFAISMGVSIYLK
ncbi:MAG TPA: hypothetical protein VFN67_39615 [Polyangiales bacterium]|nr:hypothetical protein [Polyangiales bacterium]